MTRQRVRRFVAPAVVLLPMLSLAACLFACGGDDEVELVGTVERKALEIAAPVSETIDAIEVELGDRVEAGQVLVRLDTQVAEAELEAAEAASEAARATLREAKAELERISGLRKAQVVSAQELDRARRAHDEAVAAAAERQARVAQAQKGMRDLTIRTRLAGTVDQLPFEAGERSSAGGVVAVVVADEDPWVRVWIPARVASRAPRGAAAKVFVEGLDAGFEGVLEQVSQQAEFTPHYALTEKESAHLVYESRVRLVDAPADLRAGLPARVELSLHAPQRDAS